MINKCSKFIKEELVLVIALGLALLTSFFSFPKLSYIDFKVLILLFNLMIVVAAFKKLNLLDTLAIKLLSHCSTFRKTSFILVFLTFFASMFITNDVALLTFVPLTIIIASKAKVDVLKTVIFQTLAANLGSCLTPMGNPQNLFIYSFYELSFSTFIKIMLPICVLSIIFLIVLVQTEEDSPLTTSLTLPKLGHSTHIIGFSLLFIVILLSVFRVVDYRLAFILTLLVVLILDKKLFKEVDYSLLLTFIGFFIFVGNLANLSSIKFFMEHLLSSSSSTYFTSLLTSQLISNVPATMLLSSFTPFYEGLLLGVNIGGLGTLIASLASVISYKLYVKAMPEKSSSYFRKFTYYNLLGLLIFTSIIYILMIR